MTNNGRDHWNQQDAEQRARLLRDMPLHPMDYPRQAKHPIEWTRWVEIIGVCAIVFALTIWVVSR